MLSCHRVAAILALTASLLLASPGWVTGSSPDEDTFTCPYCSCEYSDYDTPVHDVPGRNFSNTRCNDWCKKHHPVEITYGFDCTWDERNNSCVSTCAGGSLPGGCRERKEAKCKQYTHPAACNDGTAGPKDCECPLIKGFEYCESCFKCECGYTMGKMLVEVSNSHHVYATPAICKEVCHNHGKNQRATGSWAGCEGTTGNCVAAGCAKGCTMVSSSCSSNHYCLNPRTGETQCNCPLVSASIAPGCPTRDHPPVVPSVTDEEIQIV